MEACGAQPVTFEAGKRILEEGQDADGCFFIEDGDVALELCNVGLQCFAVQTLHAGDIIGWSWLFSPHKWSFDAVAASEVTALRLNATVLKEAMEADAAFGYELMHRFSEVIISRLQATRSQFIDLLPIADRVSS
jgi:CRP-like cAMP-binding protein